MKRASAAATLAVLLAGCTVGPDYVRPDLKPAAAWRTPAESPASVGEVGWWRVFGDDTLQGLIRTALAENNDVRLAVARVLEARARPTSRGPISSRAWTATPATSASASRRWASSPCPRRSRRSRTCCSTCGDGSGGPTRRPGPTSSRGRRTGWRSSSPWWPTWPRLISIYWSCTTRDQLTSVVQLYKALGGGWTPETGPTPGR